MMKINSYYNTKTWLRPYLEQGEWGWRNGKVKFLGIEDLADIKCLKAEEIAEVNWDIPFSSSKIIKQLTVLDSCWRIIK